MRSDVQAALILVRHIHDDSIPSPSLTTFITGLPAFKPGEKVEIDFGMDDIWPYQEIH